MNSIKTKAKEFCPERRWEQYITEGKGDNRFGFHQN